MRIGLDVDGVLYPWHWSLYRYFTEFKGFVGSQVEFWNYIRGVSKEETDYYVSLPFLYLDTTPTQDVIKYVPLLAQLGEIYYITSRSPELERSTLKFFDIYGLPFKDNLIFSSDKATHIRHKNIDFFVDDSPKNLDAIGRITSTFLFKQPHNFGQRDGYNCIGSLKEFYNTITTRPGVENV